jgi:hypothetical protein
MHFTLYYSVPYQTLHLNTSSSTSATLTESYFFNVHAAEGLSISSLYSVLSSLSARANLNCLPDNTPDTRLNTSSCLGCLYTYVNVVCSSGSLNWWTLRDLERYDMTPSVRSLVGGGYCADEVDLKRHQAYILLLPAIRKQRIDNHVPSQLPNPTSDHASPHLCVSTTHRTALSSAGHTLATLRPLPTKASATVAHSRIHLPTGGGDNTTFNSREFLPA